MKHNSALRRVKRKGGLILLFSILMLAQPVLGNLIGEQHTTTCKNHICTITIEAEPIRFKAGDSFLPGSGGWSEVDENYHNQTAIDCPVEGYDWCAVNMYALNLKDDYDVHIQTKFEEDFFGYKLKGIEYGNFTVYFFPGEATINGSVATYNLTEDLKYQIQYLPTSVKDAVIIDRENFFQIQPNAETFDVWYEVTPGFEYNITNGTNFPGNQSEFQRIQVMKDGKVLYEVSHIDVLNGEQLLIEQQSIEIETFGNETFFVARINSTPLIAETKYPIYIDPAVTIDTQASYDGNFYQIKRCFGPLCVESYRRINNPPSILYIGTTKIGPNEYNVRGDVEFNLSEIPFNATILEAYLNVSIQLVGSDINKNISFRQMDWHETYPPTFGGNANAWKDAGLGFQYNHLNLTPAMLFTQQEVDLLAFDSAQAISIITPFFGNVTQFYAIGFSAVNEPKPTTYLDMSQFFSRSFAIPQGRPVLVITYKEPTENWRFAILFGVIGIAGYMAYVGRRLDDEHKPLKELLYLSSFLFGYGAVAIMLIASDSLDSNVNDILITTLSASTYVILGVTAFSVVKLLNTSFNIMKGRKT